MSAQRQWPPELSMFLLGSVVLVFCFVLASLIGCQKKPADLEVEAVRPAKDSVLVNEPVQMCAFSHRPGGSPVILVPKDSATAARVYTECRPAFERWKAETSAAK